MPYVLRQFCLKLDHQIEDLTTNFTVNASLTCRGKLQWKIIIESKNVSDNVYTLKCDGADVNNKNSYERGYCKLTVLNELGNDIWSSNTETKLHQHNSFSFSTTLLLDDDCDKLKFIINMGACFNKSLTLLESHNQMISSHERMLNNGTLTDCVIKTKGKDFQCHKFVLASKSEYFRAMFELDMKEGQDKVVDWVDIFDSDTVQDLLQYFYSGKRPTGIETTYAKLVEAAGLCMLDDLKHLCAFIMSQIISVETATDILQLAERHDLYHLKESAVDFVLDNYEKVKDTVAWEDIEPQMAKNLLSTFLSITSIR